MFVDRVRVNLRAGNGGAGVVAFVRAKGQPKGKPIGGNGGAGGSVILRADSSVGTLLRYQRSSHHRAGAGTHGEGDLRHGRRGDDLALPVPLGTVVFDEEGVMIADLVVEGQEVTAVKGGRGGLGNAAFVSSANRAPGVAEQGEYGAAAWFTLELKLLADAALIGFPNAGKSTLISKISAARPKIADYPFTTLEPNLGVVSIGGREMVVADIPGLIEGAAEGRGLGHEFLRHTERARVLVMVLDPTQAVTPSDQLRVLEGEIERYSPALAARPRMILVNKCDVVDVTESLSPIGALTISAVTGEGLNAALHAMADLVDLANREAPERKGFVLHRPLGPTFAIKREGRAWRIEGRAAERAVRFADLTLAEAADLAARRLAGMGVDEALAAAGAAEGDEVRIGELTFEYSMTEEE
jgi:GTP-binding protein